LFLTTQFVERFTLILSSGDWEALITYIVDVNCETKPVLLLLWWPMISSVPLNVGLFVCKTSKRFE